MNNSSQTDSDSFDGYRRPDGRVGVRNHVAVVPVSVTASPVATQLAVEAGPPVRSTPHQMPLDPAPPAREQIERVLRGISSHPNVGATLLVALGTETIDIETLANDIVRTGTTVETLSIRGAGGTAAALRHGSDAIASLQQEARTARRESAGVEELVVALECGGSDATSGIAANPAVGNFCDRLVEAGGTGVLSETPEFIGAEHILADRCVDETVREALLSHVKQREQMAELMGVDFRGAQPSPGNQEGGLTTLEEKSLGAIAKAGTKPLRAVLEYADRLPVGGGFVVMDSPGYDVESVSGKVAGGAQVVVFTTGRGSTTGNPIAPVIKVTGNPDTFDRMAENMDLDASGVLAGQSIDAVGNPLYELVRTVASSDLTTAEQHRMEEFAINNIPPNVAAEIGSRS
jgi:altronate dehydratase large subunit